MARAGTTDVRPRARPFILDALPDDDYQSAMKPAEAVSWAQLGLTQAQWFTAVLDAGMLVLIGFVIAVVSGAPAPALYWRIGARTPALTMIELCWVVMLALVYIVLTCAVMFVPADPRLPKWSFVHGAVVGYGAPFALHLIGDAASWIQAPRSASLAGLSVLSAFLGGLTLCASFVYWAVLAQATFREVVSNRYWVGADRPVLDAGLVAGLTVLALASASSLLWAAAVVPAPLAFTFVVNAVAYALAVVYLYLVKANYFTSFMALGALAGAFAAVAIVAAKWTFHFASRWVVADTALQANLFVVAIALQAALALYVIPLLFVWKQKEDQIQIVKEGTGAHGEPRPYADELAA